MPTGAEIVTERRAGERLANLAGVLQRCDALLKKTDQSLLYGLIELLEIL